MLPWCHYMHSSDMSLGGSNRQPYYSVLFIAKEIQEWFIYEASWLIIRIKMSVNAHAHHWIKTFYCDYSMN